MATNIEIAMPTEPLFVGSYARLPIKFDPAEVDPDDLVFRMSDDLASGLVSVLQESSDGQPGKLTAMLLAGYRPGTHQLLVSSAATGDVLFEHGFEVTTSWPDDNAGPSRWITGELGILPEAAAWGGGSTGPQNVDTFPASGTRRIAIVLVDTASQRFTTDSGVLDDLRNQWLTDALGVSAPSGDAPGAGRYFREVSYGDFGLSAEVFGPVSLDDEFGDYIHDNGLIKGHYFQGVITAADGEVDYNNFDSVVCVLRSVDGPDIVPAQSAHGQATLGDGGPWATADGDKHLGLVSMPHERVPGSGPIHATLAHELGHNLHLKDQRAPGPGLRLVEHWDLMAKGARLPHFTIAHRMMLGWVDAAWIRSYNFGSMALPVDELVTLSPIELGAPPSGHKAGIEIRLADGWNYYFEYRVTQVDQIGDQSIDENRVVLVTDVRSDPGTAPITRPPILLAPDIGPSDGAILSADEAFEQNDTTTPNFPAQLRVRVESEDGQSAVLRVQYGLLDKPDPSIRPWPAGPGRRYQSPDIEIRNARSQADPEWFNTPWVGELNKVIARVKNGGLVDAPNVNVDFFVKDLNGGGTTETFLGSDMQDIPSGATVEFDADWNPPREGHYCVVVRIPLYQTPAPDSVVEFTEFNNVAQSNYDRFISDAASPARRNTALLAVGNPYELPTRVFIVPRQTNPLYRTYLGHQWLTLQPGETQHIEIMFEYAAAVIEEGRLIIDPDHLESLIFHRFPNDISFTAYIEDPRDELKHIVEHLGGTDIRVATGQRTEFARFAVEGQRVSGTVIESATGDGVKSGSIILMMTVDDGRSYEPVGNLQNGEFTTSVKADFRDIQAYYVPGRGYGDAYSAVIAKGTDGPTDPGRPGLFGQLVRYIIEALRQLFSRGS